MPAHPPLLRPLLASASGSLYSPLSSVASSSSAARQQVLRSSSTRSLSFTPPGPSPSLQPHSSASNLAMDLAMSSHLVGRPSSMLKDIKGKGKAREDTAHLASLTGGTEPAVVTPATKAKAPAARRLPRARKAAITMTPSAIERLRDLADSPSSSLLRIGVRTKGCAGMAYHLEYVDAPGKLDDVVEQDGVKVVIDSKALMTIIGSEMDWVEDRLSAKFTFHNPNVVDACGCGESFNVAPSP